MNQQPANFFRRAARWAGSLAVVLALAGAVVAGEPPATAPESKVYIVQLREPAAIEAVPGRVRTAEGSRFDSRSAAVRRYGAALEENHDRLLAAIGAPDAKLYSYRLAFNGFAARLTVEQAGRLRVHPDVQRVWEDRVKSLKTNASPTALGLLDAGSGLRTGLALTGEDVVIGVIDSGITPEHPSFTDQEQKPKPRLCRSEFGTTTLLGRWLCTRFRKPRYRAAYQPPQNWYGQCQPGVRFNTDTCNRKIIGARFYAEGFQQIYDMEPQEILSARDADGHGTHIASVAAGASVKAVIGGTELATLTGMAPRARIAVYKACWLEPGATRASCAMSDLQRAIEDAVADGVDIINYSVGTAEGGPADPDALALLAAADAGVFAAVAAGNNGPTAGTVESPGTAPWVTTVAASSRPGQRFDEVLRITQPASAVADYAFKEAGFTPTLRSSGPVNTSVVLADDGVPAIADATGSPADACQPLQNAAQVAGKIALVQRGLCTFQEKIAHAEAAGAAAVVVYSNAGAAIIMTGERGSVGIPAVMISQASGESLVARLVAGDAVVATLQKGLLATRSDTGNVMQEISARGPNPILLDIIKPDLTAPGVDILGAQTPDVANGARGELYQYLTGTSMAVPHVAGVAALLRQAHPDWSPAAIRSALMTTARQDVTKEDGATPADMFDFGAGHIVPNLAVAPGLVYDADRDDYDAFACGAGFDHVSEERCQALQDLGYSLEADQLNLPSIATSSLITERVIHRRVTNVGPAARYEASLIAPPGISASVSPPLLTLGAGESAEFAITFTNQGDPDGLDLWNVGSVTWSSGDTQVTSPIAVLPGRISVPAAVAGSAATGNQALNVEFGYSGAYTAQVSALVAPVSFTGVVTDDPLNLYTLQPDDSALPDHIRRFRVTVLPGTRYLRVAVTSTDPGSGDDLDLYLLCPDGECPDGTAVLSSATESSYEVIDILAPIPGEYVIDVHGYETDDISGGPGANFEAGLWAVTDTGGAGQFSVISAPAVATLGTSGQVTIGWQDLDPAELYLGLVIHSDGENEIAETLVEIATP